jgi:hypothetical protein
MLSRIRSVSCEDCSRSYEPIDFLALLIGYARSFERTLSDFFERLVPFGTAFMALFGRNCLPHRSSLSRFLADVDRPCLESFRTLFEQSSFARSMEHRFHWRHLGPPGAPLPRL